MHGKKYNKEEISIIQIDKNVFSFVINMKAGHADRVRSYT